MSCYLWMEWSVDVCYIQLVNCTGWLCCCSPFSLVALTKDKNGVLKSPAVRHQDLSYLSCQLVFMKLGAYNVQCTNIYNSYIIFVNSSPFKYLMDLSLLNSFGLESTLSDIRITIPAASWFPLAWWMDFPSLIFPFSVPEGVYLGDIYSWVLGFNLVT